MLPLEKHFGFGYMRLPLKDGEIDIDQTCQMVDEFLQAGFCYFDTAHGYLQGRSEPSLRKCLTSRYPRERYLLANKLTNSFFKTQEEIRPLFEEQLRACGVEYFDYYLMHSQNAEIFRHFQACRAYETAFALKEEGKIRHVGISFHDKAEVLEEILTRYPQIEVVQIQFNYADYDDPAVQSRRCYEVCLRHQKPVFVMEPVKGGHLANLPPAAEEVLRACKNGSPASYAIRFAAGFPGVEMVLSGMSSIEQLRENVRFMRQFQPLTPAELEAVRTVRQILQKQNTISCTACRYCVDGCPKQIPIPDLFAAMNARQLYHDWNAGYYYDVHARPGHRASDCVGCGQCEHACPQHLPIRELLREVAAAFETVEK